MKQYSLANKYIIYEQEEKYSWEETVELDDGSQMILKGECFIDTSLDILFLSPWEENHIVDKPINNTLTLWDKTTFFSVVEDNGILTIYLCENGKKVDEDTHKKLSAKIGCTMKYK